MTEVELTEQPAGRPELSSKVLDLPVDTEGDHCCHFPRYSFDFAKATCLVPRHRGVPEGREPQVEQHGSGDSKLRMWNVGQLPQSYPRYLLALWYLAVGSSLAQPSAVGSLQGLRHLTLNRNCLSTTAHDSDSH